MDENDRYVNEIKVRPENDQESVQPVEIKVGDVRYYVRFAPLENTKIIKVRVEKIEIVNDWVGQAVITVRSVDNKNLSDFMYDKNFVKWANFRTYEEVETALNECKKHIQKNKSDSNNVKFFVKSYCDGSKKCSAYCANCNRRFKEVSIK